MDEAPVTDRDGLSPYDLTARGYDVEEVIGQGGMSVVVRARHRETRRHVAIKIALQADKESSIRFQREGRAMLKLTNKHTIRVYDVGETGEGLPWLSMEYLEGEDLAARLNRSGPIPVDDALRVMIQVCDALMEAHEKGVIHRDIKPANLFLVRGPRSVDVRVLDFGLALDTGSIFAQLDSAETRLTKVGDIAGTSYYISPEQIRGTLLDRRTDVWGAGACLFRLLTNKHAFAGETIPQLCTSILTQPPRSLRTIHRDIPVAVEEVVHRCLEKDARHRYQNMSELQAALIRARDELKDTPMTTPVLGKTLAFGEESPLTPRIPVALKTLEGLRDRTTFNPPSSDEPTRVAPPPSSDVERTQIYASSDRVVAAQRPILEPVPSSNFDSNPTNPLAKAPPPSSVDSEPTRLRPRDALSGSAPAPMPQELIETLLGVDGTPAPAPAALAAPPGLAAPPQRPLDRTLAMSDAPSGPHLVMPQPLPTGPLPVSIPSESPFAVREPFVVIAPSSPSVPQVAIATDPRFRPMQSLPPPERSSSRGGLLLALVAFMLGIGGIPVFLYMTRPKEPPSAKLVQTSTPAPPSTTSAETATPAPPQAPASAEPSPATNDPAIAPGAPATPTTANAHRRPHPHVQPSASSSEGGEPSPWATARGGSAAATGSAEGSILEKRK